MKKRQKRKEGWFFEREREREKAYERTYQRERESERDQKRRVRVSERRVCVREKRVCQRRVCKVGFLFRVSRVSNSKLSLSPIVRVTWSHALALDCIRDILCIQFERICPLQNTFECRAEKGQLFFIRFLNSTHRGRSRIPIPFQ